MEIQMIEKLYIIKENTNSTLKATPEYVELLLKTVEIEPSILGYEFAKGSVIDYYEII
jgi:hypothetical protein